MKKRELSQSAKLKLLKKFGFDIKTGRGGKLSPTAKRQITNNWKKVAFYYSNEKQKFAWLPAGERLQNALKRGLGEKQFTPKGYFIRIPKFVNRVPKYSIDKDGVIWYHARSAKGRKVIEEIHQIDPEMLAEDPPKAIRRLTDRASRRGSKIRLTVNGWDSVTTRDFTIDALAYYIAQELLPKFLDPNVADKLDPTYNDLHNKKRKIKTIEDFADTFHIVITKYEKPAIKKKRKKSKK